MGLLGWLRRRRSTLTPVAQCPRCGATLPTFWAEDDVARALFEGLPNQPTAGDHLVLRAECDRCAWAGRANTSRVLEPHLPSPR